MSVERLSCVLLAGASLLVAAALPVAADDTYICDDGTTVTVDSSNRDAARQHPCVKAWFVKTAALRAAQLSDGEGARPPVRGLPVLRALALRDTTRRPSYFAWISRPSTTPSSVRVAAYSRKSGPVVRTSSNARTTMTRRPAFRLRFRRR